MKFYHVYKHESGHIEAVKQGWSWPAFFFGVIWALIKKLWLVAGAIIAYAIVSGFIENALLPDFVYASDEDIQSSLIISLVFTAINVGVAIFIGLKGNTFRENNLIKRGYVLVNKTNALKPEHAVSITMGNE